MNIPYDLFDAAFLSKITEYDFIKFDDEDRTKIVDDYLKRALVSFKKNCKYDFTTVENDDERFFDIDVASEDVDELVEIISEGMLVQWLKPFVYRQENLENALSTRDYSVFSPAELLMRVGNAYAKAQKDYTQMIREYSFNHNDLTVLHI